MGAGIHLIMPMAGRGSRFEKAGVFTPKPLIELHEKPFFYWSVQSVASFVKLASLDFVVLREHVENYSIQGIIKDLYPYARIHILDEVTEGAVVTCLHGIEKIQDQLPVVFNDCDHMFKSDAFNCFCNTEQNADGVLLTFQASEKKYSFIEKNAAGHVIRTAEKECISNEAICGCYYFRNADVFREHAKVYLMHCNYCEYYMSGVYNVMIDHKCRVLSMPTDFHVPYGIPEEYEAAKFDYHYLGLKS